MVFNQTDATEKRLQTTTGSDVVIASAASGSADLRFSTDKDNVGLVADLTNATAATILQLRQAMAIQALLELDARAGSRYNEIVYSVFIC